MKKVMAMLMVATLLAGCADAIPDAPTAPVITVGNNSTWLEVQVITLNATHLSFEVVENQIVFSNYTFKLEGYLNQSGYLFGNGYAPDLGSATLYTPDFPYDITIEYYCVYREWTGNE